MCAQPGLNTDIRTQHSQHKLLGGFLDHDMDEEEYASKSHAAPQCKQDSKVSFTQHALEATQVGAGGHDESSLEIARRGARWLSQRACAATTGCALPGVTHGHTTATQRRRLGTRIARGTSTGHTCPLTLGLGSLSRGRAQAGLAASVLHLRPVSSSSSLQPEETCPAAGRLKRSSDPNEA